MLNVRSNLSYVVVFALISGLVFILGCGNSPEKQKMTDFLQDFSQVVSEFAAADQGKKAELEAKLKDYMSKWTQMKYDLGAELTPQALDKMDGEYQKIAKEFKDLAGKS
jgi:hypothetical protein